MTAAAPHLREEIALTIPLESGWEMSSTAASADLSEVNELRFIPARVPGTVASTLREQKAWRPGDGTHFDASEHWFRCRFDSDVAEVGEELILRFGGIATVAEVWLNGELILKSGSMFASHDVDVTSLIRQHNELLIACRSLAAAMREQRRHPPTARWRTRVVGEQQLRWFRTTLLGRAPGFAPEPEPVGPWRPVALVRRRRIVVDKCWRRVRLEGGTGVIEVHLQIRSLQLGAALVSGRVAAGATDAALEVEEFGGRYRANAIIRIPNVRRWWPHTHGEPSLYPIRVELDLVDGSTVVFEDIPIGFRTLDGGIESSPATGFEVSVNGTPIFCRGVVWTPPDVATLSASQDTIKARLELLRDGGFNLIRIAGTTFYECDEFHRLCDELGLLIWQDMMFANMDYPFEDPRFRAAVRSEAETELARLSKHSSLTVVCGNSELEQQVAMLGLDPAIGREEFFREELPRIAATCCPGVVYLPSAPCGGDMPFRTRTGVANYFGVGAYLRPLEDVRRAEVGFASECLAFSNVPEPKMVEKLSLSTPGGVSPTHPSWKQAVPRDCGAGWDFEDVRDHYLKMLYSSDPAALRYADTDRYWELSRMVSGEVMAEVFGEWRRPASPCSGGIVLWSADLEPGAGWGILDSHGQPKAAYWFLRRALSRCTVWTTDEGLNGVDIHVANDGPSPLSANLRVALYQMGERRVAESVVAISLQEHETQTVGAEQILGRFVDAAWSYRFGPPGHDLVVASLHMNHEAIPFAQSFRFPLGRTTERKPIADLGLGAHARLLPDKSIEVTISSVRFAWGVRVSAECHLPTDAYFGIEPGGKRRIVLTPCHSGAPPARVLIHATNAEGRLPVALERTI